MNETVKSGTFLILKRQTVLKTQSHETELNPLLTGCFLRVRIVDFFFGGAPKNAECQNACTGVYSHKYGRHKHHALFFTHSVSYTHTCVCAQRERTLKRIHPSHVVKSTSQ